MERIMTWGLLVQGRLGELLRLLPEDGDWPPRSFWRTPHPMIGLLWRGEVARARQMWDEVPAAVREGAHTDLWFFHEAWLSWSEGDVDAALAAAEAAVAHSRKTSFGWEPCFDVVVGYMLILSGRVNDARSVLADSISRSSASGMRSYVEWAQAFQGLAFLRSDRVADAQRTLRRCVGSMQRAERRLMLPFAGAYLAEAEARAGEHERATAAADLAYDAAAGMGALFALQRALRDVPGVLQRQIGGDGGDGRWRRVVGVRPTGLVGAAASAAEPHDDAKVLLDVQTFGDDPDLVVNGVPCEVRRLKVLELAAHLALHPDGVDRNRLQEALFPDADQRRGGNYFRQVVHKLRQATGFGLARSAKGLVCWPPEVHVDALDVRVERALREAGSLAGRERLDRLRQAVSLATGPYLRDSELEWAEARRFELEVRLGAARVEAAELALELADADVARELAEGAIAADPFSEPAYRVLMSVEAAVGPPGAVLTVYQRLCESLDELEVEPAAATKRLVNELRSA
jgi:DNA-binding SARP family transcriptional activator